MSDSDISNASSRSEYVRIRNEKLAKLKLVSDKIYADLIPEQMVFEKLNAIYYEVFGCEIMELYLFNNVFDLPKSIIITDFESNGFFWAQLEEKSTSLEFQELFRLLNNQKAITSNPAPWNLDWSHRWCIAKFEGDWYRAYVNKKPQIVGDGIDVTVFFLDYGTHATVKLEDTRQLDDEEIWTLPPMAIPFCVKDMSLTKLKMFEKMQYECLEITEMKLIEKNCVFEVCLRNKDGTPFLSSL